MRAAADGGGAVAGRRRRPPAAAWASSCCPGPRSTSPSTARSSASSCRKIRQISAANLSRNWVRIPHVTHNDEADVTDLEAFRKQLNAEQSDVKVTMVALLLKAVVASLKAFPDMNSSLEGDGVEALIRKKYYHLGFAADTPNGLVVPVVKDVDKKGLLEVAAELTELSGKARAGQARARRDGGRDVHDLARWAASAARRSRRSSTRPRSRSSASCAARRSRCGTATSSSRA